MAGVEFNLFITREGVRQARNVSVNPGWYLTPYECRITESRSEITSNRTTASMSTNLWYSEKFSGVVADSNENSLIHTVVVPPVIAGQDGERRYGEIYFVYKNYQGDEFLYAIAAPKEEVNWIPGISQQFYFSFILSNADVETDFVINYTYPQEIESHNIRPDSHPELLARDGSRTATGILTYDQLKQFTQDNQIVNKKYIDDGMNEIWSDIKNYYNVLPNVDTIELETNSLNTITPEGPVTFVLPDVSSDNELNQILVQVNLPVVYSLNVGTSHYFNNKQPNMSTPGYYDLIFEYDRLNSFWVCGCMRK